MSAHPLFARLFRFDTSHLGALFAPRKPRHPLLRVLFGLLGLGLLVVLLVFGLFVGAAMVASGLLVRLWRRRGKPIAMQPRVVDGEYRVIRKPGLPLAR